MVNLRRFKHNVVGLLSACAVVTAPASATIIQLTELSFVVKGTVDTSPGEQTLYEDSVSLLFGDNLVANGFTANPLSSSVLGQVDLDSTTVDISRDFTASQTTTGVKAFIYFNIDVCDSAVFCPQDDEKVQQVLNLPGGDQPSNFEFGDSFFSDIFFNAIDPGVSLSGADGTSLGDDVAGALEFNLPDLAASDTFSLNFIIEDALGLRAGIGGSTGQTQPLIVFEQFNAPQIIPLPGAAALLMTAIPGWVALRRRRATNRSASSHR